MTKGKLYELCSEWNLKQDEHVCPEAIQRYIDEAKKDKPKKYIYEDFTHYYNEDAEGIEHPPYPKYQHIPTNDEWETWFKKWFLGDEE